MSLLPKKRLTKRAPDAGDSAATSSSFLRLILFLAGRLRRPHPSAGNANRWAVLCITIPKMKNKLLVMVWVIALIGCSSKYGDSAMFRGNLERTGVYDNNSETPLGKLKWKYNTGVNHLSSPTISQETVFISGQYGYVVALDSNTGKVSWEFKREKYGGSSPAISNGIVYIGSMDYDVYAIDIKTGVEKWKFTTDEYIFSSPAVSNGFVYFGNYNGYLYSVDAKTGKEKWNFKTQGTGFLETGREPSTDYELKGAIRSSPAIVENILYFGSYDGYLYALDVNTGLEKWKFKTDDVIFSTPAVADNVIYLSSDDGYLYAINGNGLEKWKFNTKDFLAIPSNAKYTFLQWISSPTIADRIAYIGVSYQWKECQCDNGSDNRLNYLFAVDITTGQLKWKIQVESVISPVTVSKDTLYYGDEEGYVFALNGETGQEIWNFKADSSIVTEVVAMDGVVYFCSQEGYVYALQ